MNLQHLALAGLGVAAIGAGVIAYRRQQAQAPMAPPPTGRQIYQRNMGNLSESQQLARENMMSLIKLRGANQAAGGGGAGRAVDVIIHGTNARGADWARANAPFAQQVAHGRNAISTSFQWSGSRLETDRQASGRQLSSFLRDVRNPMIAANRSVNAIAHSHGGNVLGHALSDNRTRIDNAVLLATPHMVGPNNPNVSWTGAATNRVRGMVAAFSTPNDLIQQQGATANEWAQRRNVMATRTFNQPASHTPQLNHMVPPMGQGAVPNALALGGHVAHALGHPGIGMGMVGAAAAAQGVQAHSDMHNQAMAQQVGRSLARAESGHGRLMLDLMRYHNTHSPQGVRQTMRNQLSGSLLR